MFARKVGTRVSLDTLAELLKDNFRNVSEITKVS